MVSESRDGVLAPHRRATTIGLLLVITLVGFEALAIATVMPKVSRDLNGISLYGWVFSAFLLAQLVGIVVAGTSADRYGPERPFLIGLVLLALGLIIGALAPSMEVLVGARAIQGLGAGVIPAVAYVVIGRAYPTQMQPRMFAMLSTAWVVPSLMGPAIAAVVASAFGWRWVFAGIIPIVAIAALLAAPPMRKLPPTVRSPDAEPPASLAGAVQVALGSGLFLAGLLAHNLFALLVLCAIGGAIAVKAFRGLVPTGTLRALPGIPAAVLSRGLLTFAFFGVDAFITLAVVEVRGGSVAMGGFALTVGALCWTTGSWIQSHYVQRLHPPLLVRLGFAIIGVAIVLFCIAVSTSVSILMFAVAWGVGGFGMGFAYAPISLVVLGGAEKGSEGRSSSALQLADVLGCAIGIGIGGALVAFGERSGWSPSSGLVINACIDLLAVVAGVSIASRLRTQPLGAQIKAP